jgi:hypothetical protein
MSIRFQAGLAALAFTTLAVLPAQSTENGEVLATIQTFLNAMKAKDTIAMKSVVDSVSRFTLLRPGTNGTRVMVLNAVDFIRVAGDPGGPTYDEPIRNPHIHIDGDLATLWAEYQVRMEGKVSHCGFDAFQLARLGGRWKILNVSDTFRRQGCGEAWAKTGS